MEKSLVKVFALPRFAVAIIFIIAAIGKIANLNTFYAELTNLHVLSPAVAAALTFFIPSLELTLSAFLIFNRFSYEASAISLILLAIFLIFQTFLWKFGTSAGGCGCFHLEALSGFHVSGVAALFRDIIFLAIASMALVICAKLNTGEK